VVHPEAFLVDRDGRGGEPSALELLAGAQRTWFLETHRLQPVIAEHLGQESERLGHPRHNEHVVGRCVNTSGPGQPVRDAQP
jgi:hypothetical protein